MKDYALFCAFSIMFGVATAQGGRHVDNALGKQQNASVDSKPILRSAIPETLELDDWPGSSLRLTIEGEYQNLLGLRIREQHVDVNGTAFTIEEDYPVWIDSTYSPSWNGKSVNVHFRQYKDEKKWKRYLEDIRLSRELAAKNKEAQDAGEPIFDIETTKMDMPPVCISVPEDDKVRVFVSVYDKEGNESESVEIKRVLEWLVSQEDLDEFSVDSDDDYYLDTETQLGILTLSSPLNIDNAALLYYQAFLNRPQPNATTWQSIGRVLRGGEPDRNVRRYLKKSRPTIKLTEAAALIPQCDWGIWSSGGLGNVPLSNLHQLGSVLSLYARTLAADGHSRASLESSITTRRLARHVGDDGIMTYLVLLGIERRSLYDIKYILGVIPLDIVTLKWLQGQLASVEDVHNSFIKAIKSQSKHAFNILRNNPNGYKLWRRKLAIIADLPYDPNEVKHLPKVIIKEAGELKETWKDIHITNHERNEIRMLLNLTNDQLLERSRQSYEIWLGSVIRLLESDNPYEKKYTELQRMEAEIREKPNDPNSILYHFDPNGIFFTYTLSDLTRIYGLQIRYRAEFNSLKAAIEIHLERAEAGRLPDSLPTGLTKDPFSGEDFEYEITENGFMLRCKGRDLEASPTEHRPGQPPKILSDKFQQYEFKVKEKN